MSANQQEILTEYKALRDEIIFHLGSQRQVVLMALVVSGTFLGIGVRERLDVLLLMTPVFVLFTSIRWSHSAACVSSLGGYIRDKIEPNLPGMNWEHYLADRPSKIRFFRVGWLENIHVLGIFALIDILALVVAFNQYDIAEWKDIQRMSWVQTGLFWFDSLSILFLPFLIRYRRM